MMEEEETGIAPFNVDGLAEIDDIDTIEDDGSSGGDIAIYSQGKEDYWNQDDVRVESVLGIIMNSKVVRSWWDPEDKSLGRAPECWSISETGAHPWSPQPQCEDACSECPMNEWGSKDNNPDGRGAKACKTKHADIIIVIDEDADLEALGPLDMVGPALLRYNMGSAQATASMRGLKKDAKAMVRSAPWFKELPEATARSILNKAQHFVVVKYGWETGPNKQNIDFSWIHPQVIAPVAASMIGDIITTMKVLAGGGLSGGGEVPSAFEIIERVSGSKPEADPEA